MTPSEDPRGRSDPEQPDPAPDSPPEPPRPAVPPGPSGHEREEPAGDRPRPAPERPEHEPIFISREPSGPPESTQEEIDSQSYAWALLNAQKSLFDKISDQRELNKMIYFFLSRAALFSAIFGATMGFHARNLQTLLAAVKAPIFLLGTMAICLPALYSFNVLLGSRLSFRQTTSVLSLTTYMMAFVMGSLAPIQFLFVSSTESKNINFLLAVLCSSIANLCLDSFD